jgi:hypothetical protein
MHDVRNARALLAERVSPAFIASCDDPPEVDTAR